MNYDVAIIGAGPAGSAAGLRLAQKGLKIIILEKAKFPRHKVCGEFFSPGSGAVWKTLGIYERLTSEMLKIEKGRVYFSGQSPLEIDLKTKEGPAYSLSRFSFDHFLLKLALEAGCALFEAEALKINETPRACRIKTTLGEITAQHVIVAAGRDHRFQTKSAGGKIGFKRHFQSIPLDRLELYFFPGGYLGLAPVENGSFNLCGILKKSALKKYENNFGVLLDYVCDVHPQLHERVVNAKTLSPWLSCVTSKGFKGKNTKRTLWAGDAAYFLEPMIGQGMTVAAACGLLAADALISGKDGKYYENECKNLLKGKQKLLDLFDPMSQITARIPIISRTAAKLFLRPGIIRRVLASPTISSPNDLVGDPF